MTQHNKKLLPIAKAMKASEGCLIYGLPETTYRKASGISQSQLKWMDQSPADFKHALDNPITPTPAMIFGRIMHHVLLTPKDAPFWAVKPGGIDFRTAAGQAWKKANAGRPWIDTGDVDLVHGIMESLSQNEMAKLAMAGAKREVSWFGHYEGGKSKVRRKGRIDLVPKGPALLDFKFVEDAREAAFERLLKEQKYHIQAAYYLDGYNQLMPHDRKTKFVFVAVEKSFPFHIVFYELDEADIEEGRVKYTQFLNTYIQCRKTDTWPVHSEQYPEGIRKLKLRRWGKTPAKDGDLIIQ